MNWDQIASALSTDPRMRQLVILAATVLLAVVVRLFFSRVVKLFTSKTVSDVDDLIARELRNPAVFTVILVGILMAFKEFDAPEIAESFVKGTTVTLIGAMWMVALLRVGRLVLGVVSRNLDTLAFVEPRTLPLFEMILKVAAVGGFLYFVCIAWNIPLTSWIASAGVMGIVVGFAAKDTLSNLFAGIFIVADSPYKVGDFVVLDNTTRGQVLEIGIRSTRLLTRDDVEITVPNAVIANSQIVNQTGGPSDRMRVRVKVEAAYGSDVDQVEKVLLASVEGVEHVCGDPAPRVRFRAFGASGLAFELLAWVDEPIFRGRVLHALNSNVYKSFNAAGIEIPYSKQDVYIKEMPGGWESR